MEDWLIQKEKEALITCAAKIHDWLSQIESPTTATGYCHDPELKAIGENLGLTPEEIAESLQFSELPYGSGFDAVIEAMKRIIDNR